VTCPTEDTKTKKRTTFGSTDITASGRDGRKPNIMATASATLPTFTARIETTAAPENRWKPSCELEML